VISIRDNYPTVISPVEGTPAYSLGIQSGDVILKIDGQSTRGFSSEDAVRKLRGPEGTPVTIAISRDGDPPRDVRIVRETIHVKSVPYAFEVAPGIGYLRLSSFSETTGDEVRAAIEKLEKAGATSLVLDLRDNPGGLLNQAVDVVENFVPKGSLVVFTKGRAPGANTKILAETARAHDERPLVVLVNGGSASAAEIVAGAIQDLDRGLVVGTTSFGKGSVQTLIALHDRNTALKLTTAKYYTPSGRSIHRDAWNRLAHDGSDAADEDAFEQGADTAFGGALAPDSAKRPTFRTRSGPHRLRRRRHHARPGGAAGHAAADRARGRAQGALLHVRHALRGAPQGRAGAAGDRACDVARLRVAAGPGEDRVHAGAARGRARRARARHATRAGPPHGRRARRRGGVQGRDRGRSAAGARARSAAPREEPERARPPDRPLSRA
jgi:C-terminal peptidase prc